jgi:flavin reductase (DIM6/NTAB) family NADH-FMN oxidoreductase RutF
LAALQISDEIKEAMMQIDTREYRRTIGLFATGVTVITAGTEHEIRGMTANAVTSVSLDPLLLLVCIDRRATMCRTISTAGRFAVNILAEDQEQLSRHFAGQQTEDRAIAFETYAHTPVLQHTLATVVCTVNEIIEGGDHLIVLGAVEAIRRSESHCSPLLYFAGRYQRMAVA